MKESTLSTVILVVLTIPMLAAVVWIATPEQIDNVVVGMVRVVVILIVAFMYGVGGIPVSNWIAEKAVSTVGDG